MRMWEGGVMEFFPIKNRQFSHLALERIVYCQKFISAAVFHSFCLSRLLVSCNPMPSSSSCSGTVV